MDIAQWGNNTELSGPTEIQGTGEFPKGMLTDCCVSWQVENRYANGVTLSPDTIGMPDFVNALRQPLIDAANRVLGQALSVATAGQLPLGVKNVPRSLITTRVLELAEAGQRLGYHDSTNRVLADLLLDWQGARKLRESAQDDVVAVFILPPSAAALEERLRARAEDSEDVVVRRMRGASATV